jgi:hypothetical protein
MYKKYFIINIAAIFILSGCSNQPKNNEDEIKFKKEMTTHFGFKNTIHALNNHVIGTVPSWHITMSEEFNLYRNDANQVCAKSGISAENVNMIKYNLLIARTDNDSCLSNHAVLYGNNAKQLMGGTPGHSANNYIGSAGAFCLPGKETIERLTRARQRAGYNNNCTDVLDGLINSTNHMLNNVKIKSVLQQHDRELIKTIANKEQLVKQEQIIQEKNRWDRINAASKREQENQSRLREQCLSNGIVGICQSSSQNNLQNICSANANPFSALENSMNQYCYVTDQFHISSKMEVRNNTNKTIKDIVFNCQQFAKSGTVLVTNNQTVYDVWNSSQSKTISIKFIKHQQVESMTCKAVSWK